MAHGVDIRKLDVYNNCAEAVQALAKVTDPVAKFSAVDQLTTKAFQHHAFTLLKGLGEDKKLSQYAKNSGMRYGLVGLGADMSIITVATIVHNCIQLSKKVMESIKPEEKERLYSVCSKPDTYIESKAIHALEKFINSDNFISKAFTDHPMHSLYKEYERLEGSKHRESCPCHKHISEQLTPSTTPSSSSVQPASSSASYARTPHFKNPYFPEPVTWPLENGATLGIGYSPYWGDQPLLFTSNDNKIWQVEFPIGEEFKYVIVKDGKIVRWEDCPNRLFKTLGDALKTTPEDERPKF